jgi:hypothetical protein
VTDSQDRALTLRCTSKVLNLLDRTAARPTGASAPPTDDDWYVNLLWLDRRKCLLVTHAGTLFSVLAVDVLQADLNQIGPLVVANIQRGLGAEGLAIDTFGRLDSVRIRLARTASRSVLGCMNDMACLCKHVVAQDRGLAHCDVPALNLQLRRNINSSRGYARPIDLAAGWARTRAEL